jgi:hypothetical protein
MSNETVKSVDTMAAGLQAGTRSGEEMVALGKFKIQCFDKDGKLKWEDENHNLVVNTGLQYMCGAALTSTTQITTWYIGLYGATATNNPAATDTMASHAGWTEVTPYGNATRPQCDFVAATLPSGTGNPSVATNSGSLAVFIINATATIGGAFLTSSSTKGGLTGTLFSAADFSAPGNRSVVLADRLFVTYTLSLAG